MPRLKRATDGPEGEDGDYQVDEKKRTVGILESGVEKVEDWLGIDNLYDSVNTPLVELPQQRAEGQGALPKDKDYIVNAGEVLIVDEFTGRVLHGRRYNEGMHQAIEAKEGVTIKDENQTLATITLQNFFRLYDKLGGMTGTAPDRGGRVQQDLQARRHPDPDQQADDPRGRLRRRLQDRAGQVRGRGRGHQGEARQGPAGPGRHHVGGEVGEALADAQAPRRPARGAQRQAARARGHDRRRGGPQGRRHGGDQHGRSRHRHHARRQPRPHRRPGAARPGPLAARDSGGVREGLARGDREGQAGGPGRARSRSSTPAGSTSWPPSGTSRGASTTSCAAVPAVRATRASRGSTSRSKTT